MKLIMKTEFENLRINDEHEYELDTCGDKQILKIYVKDRLVAKRITIKKSIRYFGSPQYKQYLMSEEDFLALLEDK
jgi:hypothetical protein